MDEQTQQRLEYETRGISLWVSCAAIGLVVSATAIYVTVRLFNKFKRQNPHTSAPSRIVERELAMDEQTQQQNGHETRDINLRAVTWSAIGLVVSAIAIYLTVGGLFNLFKSQHPSASAPSRITAPGTLPSQPRLQTNPAYDLQQLREMENARLSSYGWVDKSAGIVRIPIDRAITLVAQRGLPARGNNNDIGAKTSLQMRQEKAEVSHP